MLNYQQPKQLRVYFLEKTFSPEVYQNFLKTVKKKHRGVLVLEMETFYSYKSSDDIWKFMEGAK